MNYTEEATRRWTDRKVSGSGRFALVPMDDNTVRLYPTHREARVQVMDVNRVEIVDLEHKATPAPPRIPRRFRYPLADWKD